MPIKKKTNKKTSLWLQMSKTVGVPFTVNQAAPGFVTGHLWPSGFGAAAHLCLTRQTAASKIISVT